MANRSTRARRGPPPVYPEQHSRAKWTTALTKTLVDLMVEQVQKGNKQSNYFGKKAWKNICDEFYIKTGLKWDKEQLKNRYAVLRKQHGTVKSLLDQSDFKWDEPTGAIIASDEVWERYIREHPDAETIKTSGCPIYKHLCTIFAEAGIKEEYNGSGEFNEGTPNFITSIEPLRMFQEEPPWESEVEANTTDEQDKVQNNVPACAVGRKRGRKGINNVIANAILEMAAASKLRAHAIKQHHNKFSITECVRALDEIQGVDEQVYYAALDLFNSPHARETFLSLKHDKRLQWLFIKFSAPSSS